MINISEKKLMNEILLNLPKLGVTAFRANSGSAWASSDVVSLPDGSKLLRKPRPFRALPTGFADIFGITSDGKFFAIEVKTGTGRVTPAQENFLAHVAANGGISGVARSIEDARNIIQKGA